MKDNIALIGFMGSGKTTVGKLLAKTMDMKFVDIDKVIEAHEKKSINDIFLLLTRESNNLKNCFKLLNEIFKATASSSFVNGI